MIQRRQDSGLALETSQAVGVRGHRLGQHLYRNLAPQLGVIGTVHLPHAALAELGGDPEVGECLTDQLR